MLMIYGVSALPSAPLPENVSDKTGHFVAYAVLGVLATRAVAGGLPRRLTWSIALLAMLIASGYGALDEVHQAFVAGRSADVHDWYADTAGAVIGLGACWAWGIIAVRRNE